MGGQADPPAEGYAFRSSSAPYFTQTNAVSGPCYSYMYEVLKEVSCYK